METFLARHGLDKLLEPLRAAELETVSDLRLLTRTDLDQLGIAMGPRNRLLAALSQEASALSWDQSRSGGAMNALKMPLPLPLPLPTLPTAEPPTVAPPTVAPPTVAPPTVANEQLQWGHSQMRAWEESTSTAATGSRWLEGVEGEGTKSEATGGEGASFASESQATAALGQKQGWSHQEDVVVLGGARRYGTTWALIASLLPGRTLDAARNRYHRLRRMHPPLELEGEQQGGPTKRTSGTVYPEKGRFAFCV